MTFSLSFRPILSPSVSEASSPQLFPNGFSPELRQSALGTYGAYDEELLSPSKSNPIENEYVLLPPPKNSPAPSPRADFSNSSQSFPLKRKISPVNLEQKKNNSASPLNHQATAIAEKISSIQVCFSCRTKKTNKLWHKDPLDNTKLRCESCYQNTLKKIEKHCSSCAKLKKSAAWYKDPKEGKRTRCQFCHYKVKTQIEKYCFSCNTTKSSVAWYKAPEDKTQLRCRSCYNKSLAQMRKDKKASDLANG